MNDRFNDSRFIKWSKQVKLRDNFTCQICQQRGIPLNAHHINSWDTFVELRYDLNNGITLCAKDHELFHSIYNKGRNTAFQFEEFKRFIRLLQELARKNIKS